MVRCWNCEHLIRLYSGSPRKGRLFENEFRKCAVKGVVYERYNDYTKERDCEDYEESERKVKYEEILKIRKERFYVG